MENLYHQFQGRFLKEVYHLGRRHHDTEKKGVGDRLFSASMKHEHSNLCSMVWECMTYMGKSFNFCPTMSRSECTVVITARDRCRSSL